MNDHPPAAPAELSPDLVQLLVELSNALSRHTMYPAGHPMLLTGSDQLVAALERQLEQRPALALGITPQQIMVAGTPSDPGHPVIRELAARLHRINVGVFKISRGVDRDELSDVLRFLASEDRGGSGPPAQRWAHVRIHPLSYSQLELVGESARGAGASWATRLWLDLSRAALEDDAPDEGVVDPADVARALDTRSWDDRYGRRIAESVTDLLDACRTRGGSEALVLQSRVSQVITAMAPETLERLVTLERPAAERRRFLLDVSQSMAVDAVLDLVGAAATATSRSLSPALLQLLGKLAEYSEQGVPETRGRAEFAFRTQIRQLIEGWDEWDRRDPSPADHQRTMDNLRLAGKSPLRGASSTYECEPERLLMMSLEVGVAGPSASAAASWLITQGRTGVLRDLLAQAPHRELGPDILRHAASGKVLAELLQREPLDGSALDLVIPLLGDAALEPLMDALARAESAETRDHLVRLLVPFGDGAAARAWARMESSSWPAQRNLLSLLIRLPSLPPGFTPALFLDHPDAPVRTDALRMLFRGAATRSRAICDALASGDPAIVRMAVFASVEDCPPAAAPLLVGLMVRPDGEPGVRSAAISAAASVSQPAVVEALLSLCYVPGRWFRRPRIAGKSPVVLAALAGLARHWSEHARVKPVLALAAGHPDDDIRAAADRKPR